MSPMTEEILEQTCLYWLGELGWKIVHGPDIAPDMAEAERVSYTETLLKGRLYTALTRINPDVPSARIDEAVKKLCVTESPDLLLIISTGNPIYEIKLGVRIWQKGLKIQMMILKLLSSGICGLRGLTAPACILCT